MMPSRRQFVLGSSLLLVPSSAAAAVTVRYRAHHRTGRLVPYVMKVLKAHDKTCDSGCPFYAPSVARSLVLRHRYTKHRYFIWTHVETVRDARTFQKVEITQNAGAIRFHVVTPTPREVADLERHTQLPHEPLLDHLDINITVEAPNANNGSLTNVTFDALARASGMVGMFDGVIRRSLKSNAEATFANIEK